MEPGLDRFTGCLIGQCLGDALGFIVEGETPQVCHTYVNATVRGRRIDNIRRGAFPFGQYSDDSQLARELLLSYAQLMTFDAADYAWRIGYLFRENKVVGRGRATEKAALKVAGGTPWQEAGTPAPNAGNGSAMRAGPIGLLFADDPQALIAAAHDQGRITHTDPRCSGGAIAVAGAVALAFNNRTIEPGEFLQTLSQWTAPHSPVMADALLRLQDWLVLPPEKAVVFIARAGRPYKMQDPWPGISPYVVGSVLWSLYAFLRTPEDYFETICEAIAVGGDVDTTAAMAGAISGAHNGLSALPLDLARRLTDRGDWELDDLCNLAKAVYQTLKGAPTP